MSPLANALHNRGTSLLNFALKLPPPLNRKWSETLYFGWYQLSQDLGSAEQGRGISIFSCSSHLSPSPVPPGFPVLLSVPAAPQWFMAPGRAPKPVGISPAGSDPSAAPGPHRSDTGDKGPAPVRCHQLCPRPRPSKQRLCTDKKPSPGAAKRRCPWVEAAATTQSWSWSAFSGSAIPFTLSAFSCAWLLLSRWILLVLSSLLSLRTGLHAQHAPRLSWGKVMKEETGTLCLSTSGASQWRVQTCLPPGVLSPLSSHLIWSPAGGSDRRF